MKATLVLSDGTVLHGTGFGAKATRVGELVFNTSMTGYQEALTDPSYAGQILLMTYPLIGNYGINKTDFESDKVHPAGFVVRERSEDHEHRESNNSLHEFLAANGIPGIFGIDTRFVVRKVREHGVMPAIIATSDGAASSETEKKKLLAQLKGFEYSKIDFVSQVSTKKTLRFGSSGPGGSSGLSRKKVVLVDYGVKTGIVRELVARQVEVIVVPSSTSAAEILQHNPDGILLSNGPGDPAILHDAHKTIRQLVDHQQAGKSSIPIFGICLGHQLIAHAFGGDTFKLKFGHRGSNHAVANIRTGKTAITTQNHGFAVGKIPAGFELTHTNVNDKTVEGMRNENRKIMSVQYHPEACPGPHDSKFLFDEFVNMMD